MSAPPGPEADFSQFEQPAEQPTAAAMPRAHEQRFSIAWWLKLLALVPFAVSIVLFLFAGTLIPALVTGAFAYLGWRKPRFVGGLLIAIAPFGAFVALLGSTNLDPASQVILGFVWLGGLPLVSGVLFIVAACKRASSTLRSSVS